MLSEDLRNFAAFLITCGAAGIDAPTTKLVLRRVAAMEKQARTLEAVAVPVEARCDLPPGVVRLDVARIARRRGVALPDDSGGDAA
jgi:hypothetical protein